MERGAKRTLFKNLPSIAEHGGDRRQGKTQMLRPRTPLIPPHQKDPLP